ncbi:MAG: lysine--tRNA ligase [Candidatus Paceibacterota bacterium]
MASLEEIKSERLKKIELLRDAGMQAYPATTNRTSDIRTFVSTFEQLEKEQTEKTLAGRVRSIRLHGALAFFDLFDGTGSIQVYLKKDTLGEPLFTLFENTVDESDFIEVTGGASTTKRGVRSIKPTGWRMLTKSLRPVPESFYGLKDEEERLRKRYLDILLNPEVRDLIEKKSKFWDVTRSFLKERGFLEVETPTLEVTTGGAEANPFKTHHNDFDLNVYLRISIGELWQKKLMASGIEKTFEIGRAYRNEGSSTEHVQEFTNMECYGAYINLDEGKKLTQDLYRTLALKVFNTTQFTTRGHTFDLALDWPEIDYVSEVLNQTGVDVLDSSEEEMTRALKKLDIQFDGKNRERLTDALWKYCRRHISGPAFLINHPKIVAPLSKEHEKDNRKTEMFQIIVAGSEMGRAHAELNDPVDQQSRFEAQGKLIEGGDKEAMMPDHEFIEALEYGIPPTFGFGFGERLFAYLADKPIREIAIFPLMKPKKELDGN